MLIAAVVCGLISASPARAQQFAMFVNGDPITTYDIEQRTKLIQVTSRKTPGRQEVIDDLISDKLKVQIGRRYRLEDGRTFASPSAAAVAVNRSLAVTACWRLMPYFCASRSA